MPIEIRNKLLLVSIYIAGYATMFYTQSYFTSYLNLEDYGDLSVAIYAANLFAILTMAGFGGATIKFVPRFFSEEMFSELKGFILTGIMVIVTVGLVVSLITVTVLETLHMAFGFTNHPIMVAVPLIFPVAFFWYAQALMTAQAQIVKGAIWGQILFPLTLFLSAYFFVNYPIGEAPLDNTKPLTEIMALEAHIFSRLIITLVLAFFIFRIWKNGYSPSKPLYRFKEWAVSSSGFFASAVPLVSITTASMVLLEVLHPDEDDVGIFAAGLVIASFQIVILDAIRQFSCTQLSVAIKSNNVHEVVKILRPALRILGTIGLIIVIALWSVGDLLQVLNISGLEARYVVGTLGIAFLINTMSGLLLTIMQYSGNMRRAALTNVSILLLNIIFCVVLIPIFAAEGAALALLMAYLIPHCTNYFWISKNLGIPYLQCIFSNKAGQLDCN